MNKEEAAQILKEYLEDYRLRSYDELLCLVEDQHRYEVTGKSGQFYQIELSGFWDDKKLRHLRVCGSIDDGGLRAFFPVTDSFIIAPDGRFVDE